MPGWISRRRRRVATRVAPLFSRDGFALFWVARMCAALAVHAESVAIGWQVHTVAREARSLEQSAFLVGMVGLSQFVPLFLLTLFVGTVADRCDRRMILQLCVVIGTGCALALALHSLHPYVGLLPVFAVAAVFGASRALMSPAEGALGPMLVPRDVLPGGELVELAGRPGLPRHRSVAWRCALRGIAGGGLRQPGCAVCRRGGCVAVHAREHASHAAGRLAFRAYPRRARLRLDQQDRVRSDFPGPVCRAAGRRNGVVAGVRERHPEGGCARLRRASLGSGDRRGGNGVCAHALATASARGALDVWGCHDILRGHTRVRGVSLDARLDDRADCIGRGGHDLRLRPAGGGATRYAMRGRVSAVAGLFISGSAELCAFETGVVARVPGPVGATIFGGVGLLPVTGIWSRLFPALRKADQLDGQQA
jgi:hypothetical protein